jgi:hypothetical protein
MADFLAVVGIAAFMAVMLGLIWALDLVDRPASVVRV